jgi:hypothetical protein
VPAFIPPALGKTKMAQIPKQIFMKTILLLMLVCLLQTVAFGEDKIYPSEAAQSASNILSKVHAEIADKIRSRLQTEVGMQDLQTLLTFLDSESNSVVQSKIKNKLDLAANQLETAQNKAEGLLADPDNKTELSLNADKWLNEIQLQKAEETILLANIGHLRSVIAELLQWDQVLDPVVPPSQISEKLKIRLNEILNRWDQQPNSTNSNQAQIGNIPGDKIPVTLDAGAPKTDLKSQQQQQVADLQNQRQHEMVLAPENTANEKQSQQVESDTSNDQSRQPAPVAAQAHPVKRQSQNNDWRDSRLRADAVVHVLVQNTTPFVLHITFFSPPNFVWPSPGHAFQAMPGQSIQIALRGIAGQGVFFRATSPNNPYARWGAENQSPIATCGEGGPVSILVQ